MIGYLIHHLFKRFKSAEIQLFILFISMGKVFHIFASFVYYFFTKIFMV